MSEVLEDAPAPAVTGNKKQLALALGVHLVTLDRWLIRFGEAVPCIQRGALGKPYLFDIAATVDFFRIQREEEAARQRDRDEQLAQLSLPIELTGTEPPGVLSLKDQLLALQLRTKQREEAERMKKLVSAEAMREALAETFAGLSRTLHRRLRMACLERGLPDEVIQKLDRAITEAQREAVEDMARRAKDAAPGVANDVDPDLL